MVQAVEQDTAAATRPVAYRAIRSSDGAEVAALAARRGLSEAAAQRLLRGSGATAVLPSGALLEGLEADPGPLLRELRYRTCLEEPSAEERQRLERGYFQPLRILRDRWWWNPMAMSVLARQLSEHNFVLIDNFLPDAEVRRLRECNEALYLGDQMQPGGTTGGSSRVGQPHRGDALKWVSFNGPGEAEQGVRGFAACVEVAVNAMRQCAEREAPEVAAALRQVRWRSEAMLTCYPAEERARYFRHTDNSSGNGRLLTAILYLNEDWKPGDGGELRLFEPGEKNLKIKLEVEPLWNRLLLFWADERCPHEVLSACRDRYACTVWYYSGLNPDVPLTEIATGAAARAAEAAWPGAARALDLRGPEAAAALRAAGRAAWAAAGSAGGAALRAELGGAFLLLPDGAVLTKAEGEEWMLNYELEYWRSVRPGAAAREGLRSGLLAPLARARERAAAAGGEPWWAGAEAVQVWGEALARDSFIVLDEFLPPPGIAALVAAQDRLRKRMGPGRTDALASAKGRGDSVAWASAEDVPELGPLVEQLNGLVSAMMELPEPAIQARLQDVSALSDAQFAIFPGSSAEASPDARYIRHVDNEDGLNGRLLTCTFYLNEGWKEEEDGGEIRLFAPDQKAVKADVAPLGNRLVAFFSDSSVPHEVRRARRERRAVTIWYLDEAKHLAYHSRQVAAGT